MSLEEKTEKTTMKESELRQIIKDETKDGLKEFAEKEVAEKIDILLTEQKKVLATMPKTSSKSRCRI